MAEPPAPIAGHVMPRWRAVALFAVVYYLSLRLGLLYAPPPAFVSAMWPPAGVTLAAALHLGPHAGAVIWSVVALFGAGVLFTAGLHDPWLSAAVAIVTALGSTLRAVVGARLLRRWGGPRPSLTNVRTVAALVAGAGVGASLLSAACGVAVRVLAGLVEPEMAETAFVTWWLADVAGVTVVGPILLSLLDRPTRKRPRRWGEAALVLGSGVLIAITGFSGVLGPHLSRPIFMLLVPVVVWAAFRFSVLATTLGVGALGAVLLWGGTGLGLDPVGKESPESFVLVVQLFLVTLAGTALFLGATVEEGREANRRLRETTSLLQGVTEGTPDVVFVKDRVGRYLSVNRAGARYMERSVEEIIGKTDEELFDPDLLRQVRSYDRLVLETGEVRTDEYSEIKHGKRRAFLATKGPVRDAQGEIVGIFGISREITNRKLERMLLNGILEGTHDLVSAVDLHFRFVAFNQALKDEYKGRFGVDLVQGAKMSDLLAEHPEALARRLALLSRAFRGEEARDTWTLGSDTAEAKWYDVLASPLRDETGHVIGGALIGRDVTKAREAETGLRASQLRFFSLSLQAPVGIFETDLSGRCTFVNAAWCTLTGILEEEALGQAWNQAVHPDDLARVVFAWDDTVERGRTFRLEYRFLHPSGRVLWVTGAAEPLKDARSRVVGYLGTAADVTEQRRTAEDLRRTSEALASANRELESFSYSVSHDLRAPLRGIDGFSRALQEDYGEKLPAEAVGYLDRIRRATQRMGQIIDDLLLLARVARSELKREPVDLSALAHEVDASLRAAEPGRDVDFSVADGLTVEADGRLVRLLLENLLGNAWKYTSKRPCAHLELGLRDGSDDSAFFVKDDGAGFNMAYAHKLFGAFQRLHNTSEFPGSGIGLATVARIVGRHGGRVWAEAEEGKGATFFFNLGPGGAA